MNKKEIIMKVNFVKKKTKKKKKSARLRRKKKVLQSFENIKKEQINIERRKKRHQ